MSNAVVRAALETKLKQWADSQSPAVPVSFENVSFTKPSDGTFLECMLIPNMTLNKEVSGSRATLVGLFQVNCWARQGKGMRAAEQLAQNVINLYPIVPKTGAVSIEGTPYAESPLYDNSGWIIVPVVINYRLEKPL